MEMIPVESSNIFSIGYDPEEEKLYIQFHSGAIYEYYNVPQFIFDELMSAESKGRYAHQNIYKVFAQQRIQ